MRTASRLRQRFTLILCCAFLTPWSLLAQTASKAPIGWWDGTIQSKAGEVNFGIDLQAKTDGTLQATLVNATDRQPFSSAAWKDGVLTLRMDYYDGVLTAHTVSPQRMEGEYSRQTSKGMVHIPLVLVLVHIRPHQEIAPGKPWTGMSLWGDWLFHWADGEGAEKTTLAKFDQEKTATGEWSCCGHRGDRAGQRRLLVYCMERSSSLPTARRVSI